MTDLLFKVKPTEKPDMNRMVAEKLRTTTSGCNCQRMLLILVQNGEVMSYETLTPTPCFLREAKTKEERSYRDYRPALIKNGEAFYEEIDHYGLGFFKDFDPNLADIERHPRLVPTFQFNGKNYYQDECDYSNEALSEAFDSYSCPDEIKELPNGIYQVLFEQACYSYSTYEGTEGDTDFDYKIYDSVPLWEFLRYKDGLLAEAEPEAEEMVDAYVYIQQTKQKRFKPKVGTITPEQFVKGDLPWQ